MIIRGSLLGDKAAGVWTTHLRLAPKLMNEWSFIHSSIHLHCAHRDKFTLMSIACGCGLDSSSLAVSIVWPICPCKETCDQNLKKKQQKRYEIWQMVVWSAILQSLSSKFPYTAILELHTLRHATFPVLSNHARQVGSLSGSFFFLNSCFQGWILWRGIHKSAGRLNIGQMPSRWIFSDISRF